MLGLKIENRRALDNVEQILSVPGVAFAEWGPGDMSMSFVYVEIPEPLTEELIQAREKVFTACKENGVRFLEYGTPDTIAGKIDEGIRVVSAEGPLGEDTARVGRLYSGRTMPV